MISRYRIRDSLAAGFRAAPRFRGKARIGMLLGERLFKVNRAPESEVRIRMRSGLSYTLDLRTWLHRAPYWTGVYEPAMMERLCRVLQRDFTALDVGANIGFYALAFAERLRSLGEGRVYAFEPVKGNFDALERHIVMNELGEYAVAVNVALGSASGEITMYTGKQFYADQVNAVMLTGTVQQYVTETFGADQQRTESARVETLDQIALDLRIGRCDLIKVDIEGAEMEFLRGGQDFISRHRPVIFGEFNPVWMRQFGYTLSDVADLVIPWGYRLYHHAGRGGFVRIREPREGLEHLLLVPIDADARILSALNIDGPVA